MTAYFSHLPRVAGSIRPHHGYTCRALRDFADHVGVLGVKVIYGRVHVAYRFTDGGLVVTFVYPANDPSARSAAAELVRSVDEFLEKARGAFGSQIGWMADYEVRALDWRTTAAHEGARDVEFFLIPAAPAPLPVSDWSLDDVDYVRFVFDGPEAEYLDCCDYEDGE